MRRGNVVTVTKCLVLGLLSLPLVACGQASDLAAPPASSATVEPPSPTPPRRVIQRDEPRTYEVGDRVDLKVITQEVSKYETRVGVAKTAGQGSHWEAVLLESCNSDLPKRIHETVFSWTVWYLEDPWGERYQAAIVTRKGFPSPEYPVSGTTLEEGECVSGWIVFKVPDGSVAPKWVIHGQEEDVYAVWALR